MASMIFSDEEARYLRAVLNWQEKPENMMNRPVGEFRILVIGAQGVGKTSILTRSFTGAFPDPSDLSSSKYSHGCRRNIAIDSNEGKHIGSSVYTIDALEFPAEHLASPNHLTQAMAITEAAVLVYDVTDLASLTYLKSLAGTMHKALHRPRSTSPPSKRRTFPLSSSPTREWGHDSVVRTRPYHFLLLGTKRDAPENLREVSWLEGQLATEQFFGPNGVASGSSASFLEVSARTGERVGAMFPLLGSEILKSRKERRESSQASLERGTGGFGRDGSDASDNGNAVDANDGAAVENETMTGPVRRKWWTLKTSLSVSIFKR